MVGRTACAEDLSAFEEEGLWMTSSAWITNSSPVQCQLPRLPRLPDFQTLIAIAHSLSSSGTSDDLTEMTAMIQA